ncbi:MAG: biotin synthase BioB [Planctomycetes bacterium]|nr:biotin synthase BioB [Planctomycetota bacterium]
MMNVTDQRELRWNDVADRVLSGEGLSRDDARDVLASSDDELLALLAATFRVRRRYFGTAVHLYYLRNAKSGLCPEDCGYCSQSAVSTAGIDRYPLQSRERLLSGAREAAAAQARTYCIVASGRGPSDREVEHIAGTVEAIKSELGLHICCCLGLLDDAQAQRLKSAGVDRINHNLNTSRRFYDEICTTHTYDDRLATLRTARRAGLELCCGLIVGMGETADDVVDAALELRDIGVESIPVNFLIPIDGTPLAGVRELSSRDCLRTLCLLRLTNPATEIRIAGGREVHLRTLQPLGLYAANSMFVSDYLTTKGQTPEEDYRMIEDLGFEIVAHAGPVEPPVDAETVGAELS